MMRRSAPVLLLLLMIGATAARAGAPPRFEITPLLGYRFESSFNGVVEGTSASTEVRDGKVYGLSFGVFVVPDAELELLWTRQDTQLQPQTFMGPTEAGLPLTIDTFHINGMYLFSDGVKGVRGFFSFGVGLTRFEPPTGYDSEIRFSASAGLGAKFLPTPHVGFRVGARVIPTFFSSNGAVFCTSEGGCWASVSGTAFWLVEVNAGVIFAF